MCGITSNPAGEWAAAVAAAGLAFPLRAGAWWVDAEWVPAGCSAERNCRRWEDDPIGGWMAKVQSSVRGAAPSRELVLTNDGRLVTDDAATMASSEPESMTESPHL